MLEYLVHLEVFVHAWFCMWVEIAAVDLTLFPRGQEDAESTAASHDVADDRSLRNLLSQNRSFPA